MSITYKQHAVYNVYIDSDQFKVNYVEGLPCNKLSRGSKTQGISRYTCAAGMAGRIIHTIEFVIFLSPLLCDYKLYKTVYSPFLLTSHTQLKLRSYLLNSSTICVRRGLRTVTHSHLLDVYTNALQLL